MNEINYCNLVRKDFFLLFLFISICIVATRSFADESLHAAPDCSSIKIHYKDRPEMTQNERIEEMNRAFFESVNQFELCNLATQSKSKAKTETVSRDKSSSGRGEGSDGNGVEESESTLESVENPAITGTELESTPFHAPEVAAVQDKEKDNSRTVNNSDMTGTVLEDIPDVNNDDAVAAQIRLAAEIEKDAIKKEKLWNEYRKYKKFSRKEHEK